MQCLAIVSAAFSVAGNLEIGKLMILHGLNMRDVTLTVTASDGAKETVSTR